MIRVLSVLLILSACAPARAAVTLTAPAQPVIVTLTFDDGDADNYVLLPLLHQYGLHATFYIPSGLVGKTNYMKWEQLQALQAAGNEIGGHSLDHVKLGGLSSVQLQHEICDDRQNLIQHGFSPVSFAYPFGNYDQSVHDFVRQCGYEGARTVTGGPQKLPVPDLYAVRAMPYIVSDTDLAKIQRYVNQARGAGSQWVVLTFHHVCDGCDYFSVRQELMVQLLRWLARQQNLGNVRVLTFGDELGVER